MLTLINYHQIILVNSNQVVYPNDGTCTVLVLP